MWKFRFYHDKHSIGRVGETVNKRVDRLEKFRRENFSRSTYRFCWRVFDPKNPEERNFFQRLNFNIKYLEFQGTSFPHMGFRIAKNRRRFRKEETRVASLAKKGSIL